MDNWMEDDIEQAYLRALEVTDSIEWEVDQESETTPASQQTGLPESVAPDSESTSVDGTLISNAETTNTGVHSETSLTGSVALRPRVTPGQVIEAALFVGGGPLTTKKLSTLLSGENKKETVEQTIEELNRQYADEDRPYEIALVEGGYRMRLRSDFERIRNRVFGLGPKEVRLSQESLEVLALVAYRQPISRQQIEAAGKENSGGVVRQLLRRELIAIERDEKRRKDIKYKTTSRFLSLFGLGSLDELPQADDLNFR
jgi:segregation and condensation protein B